MTASSGHAARRAVAAFLGLALAVAGPLAPARAADGAMLVVQGAGGVEIAPDVADIAIGVRSEEPTPAQALDANSAAMSRVIADAKRAGLQERDIQTGVLQLAPYRRDDKGREVVLYQAVNAVRVRVRDLPRLGTVLRELVGSGANQIQGVRFSVADPTPHLDRARQQAVADASRRAELLAAAAGRRLGPILEITEATAGDPGIVTARAAGPAVPVEPGQVGLRASVQIKWRLEP